MLATIGCIVAAVAPNIPALIAGETLIGLGAASQLSYACKDMILKTFASCHLTLIQLLWESLYPRPTDSWLRLGCKITSRSPQPFGRVIESSRFAWAIPSSGFAPAISYAFVFRTSVGWRGLVSHFTPLLPCSFLNVSTNHIDIQHILPPHRSERRDNPRLVLLLQAPHLRHEALPQRQNSVPQRLRLHRDAPFHAWPPALSHGYIMGREFAPVGLRARHRHNRCWLPVAGGVLRVRGVRWVEGATVADASSQEYAVEYHGASLGSRGGDLLCVGDFVAEYGGYAV